MNDKKQFSHFLFNGVNFTFPTPASLRQATCPPLPGAQLKGLSYYSTLLKPLFPPCRNTMTGSSTFLRAESLAEPRHSAKASAVAVPRRERR